jgi:hypothetical protein
VVLEPGDGRPRRLVERALEEDVADHARPARDRLEREQRRTGQPRAVAVAVPAPEQLVAAAHREQRHSVVDRRANRLRPRLEVGRDHALLAILAAPDVEEVVRRWFERRADGQRLDAELVPSGRGAACQHGDVAAVGVDVQVLRVQVPDTEDHAAPSPSQNGRVRPRSVAIRRSSSIAV